MTTNKMINDKTDFYQLFCVPEVWNELLSRIRANDEYKAFKRTIKILFYRNCFEL